MKAQKQFFLSEAIFGDLDDKDQASYAKFIFAELTPSTSGVKKKVAKFLIERFNFIFRSLSKLSSRGKTKTR